MRLPSDTRMPTNGMFRFGVAIPAAAGANQATATVLTSQVNAVTAADGARGVALPPAELNKTVLILNTVAGSVLKVYPAVGSVDQINALGADVAFSLDGGAAAWFIGGSSGQWYVEVASAGAQTVGGSKTFTSQAQFPSGLTTKQAVNNVNDTTPTAAELTTGFGTPAAVGRGFLGTVDDNSGDVNGYIVWSSGTSFYFLKGTKAV